MKAVKLSIRPHGRMLSRAFGSGCQAIKNKPNSAKPNAYQRFGLALFL